MRLLGIILVLDKDTETKQRERERKLHPTRGEISEIPTAYLLWILMREEVTFGIMVVIKDKRHH